MSLPHRRLLITSIAASALFLAGCGTDSAASGDSDALNVVASTNVYADIVEQIGGDKVNVISIIDDPSLDPHSYEATTQDQLKLSKADVVVQNGGGYDAFIDSMLNAVDSDPAIVNTVDVSGFEEGTEAGHDHAAEEGHDHAEEGHDHAEEGHDHAAEDGHDHAEEGHDHASFNEHLWYSLPTMSKLADQVAATLGEQDTAGKAEFDKNAEAFKTEMKTLTDTQAALKKTYGETPIAITEPVALWLLEDSGLHNETPSAFSAAIEEGSDVSPTVLNDTLELLNKKQVRVLVNNTQSAGAESEKVEQAAKSNNIPVVGVTETLPAGTDYIGWMTKNLSNLETALKG
ncbi:zinc ABC transporter substrate-binding protein [Saxibacter everestensis]|uniref:Zinc ABC transporter substrate-binding protein n=1 Tax=Saxibacter everestensis TaxID=2909229 RepID=A0ABY8QQ33_9MICO|nr:zinc ABC transporter substrate-binding protein [Brevibacteriaceae bacterium ZFBP1038]